MRTSKARRLRFGILAARHHHERDRLTDWQTDYLEACEASGWVAVRDSRKAYDKEAWEAFMRWLRRHIGP